MSDNEVANTEKMSFFPGDDLPISIVDGWEEERNERIQKFVEYCQLNGGKCPENVATIAVDWASYVTTQDLEREQLIEAFEEAEGVIDDESVNITPLVIAAVLLIEKAEGKSRDELRMKEQQMRYAFQQVSAYWDVRGAKVLGQIFGFGWYQNNMVCELIRRSKGIVLE